jgi:hypothetical protein
MGKTHQNPKKTTQPKSETNELATRKNINSINRKQTASMQSSTQTRIDPWKSVMGYSLQFQHRNAPAISIQNSPIDSVRTLVHKQPQDQ